MITILDLGNELKKLDNFDKDEYIKALEKEVARFIRNADIHVINHQKMYEELRATKHALWMARSLRAEEHTFIYSPRREKWQWVERKCLQKAKDFE